MIFVRPALPSDIPWLLGELRAFSAYFGSQLPLYTTDELATVKLEALMDPALGCFYVADDVHGPWSGDPEAEPVGFISGLCVPQFFNPAIVTLTELLWWVRPERRGSRAGALLLNAFLSYGRRHADWVVFGLEAHSPVNPATLERRGFRLREHSYLLECA